MLSSLAWLPRGAAHFVPKSSDEEVDDDVVGEEEEQEEEDERGEEEVEGREGDDVEDGFGEEAEGDEEAVSRAGVSGFKKAISKGKGDHGEGVQGRKGKKGRANTDLADELAELDMDTYDEEEERAINLFGTGKGLGGTYYQSNEEDPYLVDQGDEDEDEIDDLTIRPSDLLLLAARNEDDVSFIELWVCEETEGEEGEEGFNMYVHHDVMIPAFPLSMAWMDFNVSAATSESPSTSQGQASFSTHSAGNFVAVGTMNPEIEVWNLDILDEVAPALTLGGYSQQPQVALKPNSTKTATKKGLRKRTVKAPKAPQRVLQPDSHEGAVMSLAWNSEFRNVLASGSEDCSVKLWDLATASCQRTLTQHSGKVQSVQWSPTTPSLLLSGSFDKTVALVDARALDQECLRWPVTADVEATVWNPHNEHQFLVSTEDGLVCAFDSRTASTSANAAAGRALFTLSAHTKATCAMVFNPQAPNLLATGSTDKKVKLWDLSEGVPKCLHVHNPKAGAVFSLAFCADAPAILALGGSKGTVHLWNIARLKAVAPHFQMA